MKLKRLISCAFVLCLLVTGFSGCSKEDKLSAKQEQEIKEAYATFYNETHPNHDDISVEHVDIAKYYGTYNDAVVMLIYPCDDTDVDALGQIYIAGYEIITASGYPPLFVYKDGTFTEIEEAYENGILTIQDIAYIEWRSKGGNKK